MNRKIRILYTIPNFDTAGSGKVLYDLAKGLDSECFEISIACKHNKGSFFKDVEVLGFPIYLIDTTVPLRPYYNLLFRIKPFKDFIKAHQFDIVHSWHWSSDWSEVLATRLAGGIFVYTKKAMTWGNIHWKIRSYLSHFIITVNDAMTNYFPFKKNQKLIPFGLDLSYYNPEFLDKKQNFSKFTVVTVANLVPVKHIEVIIKAIERVSSLNMHLNILGDDTTPYANTLKQLTVDLKLENQVSFLGKQADVRPFLAQADLYIISSLKEGMPMALVEAMAMGLPVLGSNVSGIKFILREFPDLLFEPGDDNSLSLKIQDIYLKTPEERLQLGELCRDYCVSNFSMQRFINAHETLYLDLKNTKRP